MFGGAGATAVEPPGWTSVASAGPAAVVTQATAANATAAPRILYLIGCSLLAGKARPLPAPRKGCGAAFEGVAERAKGRIRCVAKIRPCGRYRTRRCAATIQ